MTSKTNVIRESPTDKKYYYGTDNNGTINKFSNNLSFLFRILGYFSIGYYNYSSKDCNKMADKKDNGITDFMHKPESPTLKELIAITIFITSLILTMQFPISLYLALVTMGVLLIVEEIIRRKSVEEKQFFKALSKIGLALWAFLVIMIIIDHALTYLAVHHLVIAQEKNPFLKMLWDNHGYLIGEIIALVYASAIIIPLNISLRSKNKHLVIGAFTVVLLALIVWALVVCNNISILLDYLL